MNQVYRCCVLLPFRGRRPSLERVIEGLIPQLSEGVLSAPDLSALIDRPEIHALRHDHNLGVAAARNTGISWCLEQGKEGVLRSP